ncbi:MAG: transcription termination/antitermination protein NusA [Candidatus Microthrix sp.]|nr:transcription termination factor NusA [Candidatus Microthrix sp.]MBK9558162.1 transcription termination/antitermination protein NusA [Candidatus Microthrix sp.]
MNLAMMDALGELAAHKGISTETLLTVLADAIDAAYKKMPGAEEFAWTEIDAETGEIRVWAQELGEDYELLGEPYDVTPSDMGRIAAQAAKQVMNQRIRETEREMKYEEYAGREGGIVTGIVQQTDSRYTLLDLGRVEALMPQSEQVPHERAHAGDRVKAYIVEVRMTAKGPQIVVSRTHPGLIRRLFEMEVPEIEDGIVEIKACAREPGQRTKIAVWSNDPNIDPVGACVGARGARVRQVVNELRGEKIDIVPFSDDEIEFVAKALQPARVREVRIHRDLGTAEVIVPDFQLSLAIGKEGQNARLAHRLTGLRIDIRSETEDAQADYQPYEEGADYADGEWVVDPESGEQMWQPADGSAPLSLEDWNKLTDAAAGDEAAGEATADEAAGEESPSAEASGDEATDTAEVDDGEVSASADDGGDAEQAAETEPDESNEAISDEAADADEAT